MDRFVCWCRYKVGYPDLSNTTYLSRLAVMFLSCFPHFLREHLGLGLESSLGLGIRLALGDRVRVSFEVKVRSVLFI